MAIFAVLELESRVQVNDKTRLNGAKSFITPDESAITLVEIRPSATDPYISVTSTKLVDWQYSSAGTKTVDIRITTSGAPVVVSKTIEVVTAATDNLFSSDADITAHEVDILKYVAAGRNSFLDKHRAAQNRILTNLDEMRIHDVNGNRLTAEAVVDTIEVRDWSKFLTLQYIFEGISNAIDDIFAKKAKTYEKMADAAKTRAVLRLDLNDDGQIDPGERTDMQSFRMVRR